MLELRYPPAHRIDEQHLAAVRRIIAEVLEAKQQRGNRAGNQAIIDKIGLDARLVQSEVRQGFTCRHATPLVPPVSAASKCYCSEFGTLRRAQE